MTATPFPYVLWAALLLAVAVIDAGAYLVAGARAQGAADAAALAAVTREATPRPGAPAAARLAEAHGARLDTCGCRRGSGRASVAVSVPVGGLFVPRINGMRRVTASADAQLVHAPAGAGPQRETDLEHPPPPPGTPPPRTPPPSTLGAPDRPPPSLEG